MSRVGRPSRLTAERRRTDLARLLARWAGEDATTVKRLVEELHVGERAIRSDLERLAQGEADVLRLPMELATELEKLKTIDDVSAFALRVMVETGLGRLSAAEASFYMSACRELRQTFKDAKRARPSDFDIGPLLQLDAPLGTGSEPTSSEASPEAT